MSAFHAIAFAEVEQGTPEWREARKQGVGGSDAAAAIGLDPYKTPLALWMEKRDLVPEFEGNWNTQRGTALEPLIRQHYAETTGRVVKLPRHLLQHPKHPFMLASIDGFTDCGRLQEYKTAGRMDGWGNPGTDEIPIKYLVQCQHNMAVTGLDVCDVGASIGLDEPVYYLVRADAQLQESIIQREAQFWEMVQSGEQPHMSSPEDALMRYPHAAPITLEATEELVSLVDRLRGLATERKQSYAEESGIKTQIMAEMQTADMLMRHGKVLATWIQYDSGRKFIVKN